MKLIIKVSLVFFLIAPTLSFGQSNQKPIISSTKYYASFTGIVSSYLDYTPRGEITNKTALNISHYKVAYDINDQILEIAFFKGKSPSNNSYYNTHMVKYHYSKNKIIRTYFDNTGSKSNMWRHYYSGGNIHLEKFITDEKGNKVELTFRDSLNNSVENGAGTFLIKWKKIDYRSVIQEHFNKEGGVSVYRKFMPFERIRITTDENGYSKYVSNIDSNNKIIFDSENGFATLEVFFDDYGNENGWGWLDESGNLVNLKEQYGHSICKFTKKYRNVEHGTVKSYRENYYDKNKNTVANDEGVHEVRYTRDEYANIISIAYFDLKGQKTNNSKTNGYHRVETIYNNLKERIKTVRYNTKDELIRE